MQTGNLLKLFKDFSPKEFCVSPLHCTIIIFQLSAKLSSNICSTRNTHFRCELSNTAQWRYVRFKVVLESLSFDKFARYVMLNRNMLRENYHWDAGKNDCHLYLIQLLGLRKSTQASILPEFQQQLLIKLSYKTFKAWKKLLQIFFTSLS